MSYIEMKEWLDRQVANREVERSLKNFNSQICAVDTPNERRIHVSDIDKVADLMGEKLVEVYHSGKYVERRFMYEGYAVFGLVEKYDTENLSD